MRATVIIPTFGRPVALKNALRSLLPLNPQDLGVEILVVDNNVDAAISADLRSACAAWGDPIRYTAEPSPGQSAARHRGAREARGDLLIFIDDDVQVSPGWLTALLGAFDDTSIGIAGGPSIPNFSGHVPAWFWDYFQPTPHGGWMCGWLSLLDLGRTVMDIDPVWLWGLNLAIRRDVLNALGGFHPDVVPAALQRWQGDGETGLASKAKSTGVRCVYLQDALLHHAAGAERLTPEYFGRRAYYQGICDSFTAIRAGKVPSVGDEGPPPPPPYQFESGWRRIAHEVKAHTDKAYVQGWNFHQREAAGDPALLRWIRRETYWDADINEELRARSRA